MATERQACTIPKARLKAWLDQGRSYEAIARETGFKSDTIRMRALSWGLATRRPPPPPAPSEEALRYLLAVQGVSFVDIACSLRMTPGELRGAARRYGLPVSVEGRAALRSARS